jgi:methyl-accepting chemotaxis protein
MSMSHEAALLAITAVVSAALVFQVIASWGMVRAIRGMSGRIEALAADVERKIGPLSQRAEELLVTARSVGEHFATIEQQVATTAQVVHGRVVALDAFLEETTESARLQVARVSDLIETSSGRIDDTIQQVQRGILAPLNEVSALLRGVRVGFDFFFRGRKPARQAHQDEEMFI